MQKRLASSLFALLLLSATLAAAERAVHIIHTSDLHGHIEADDNSNGLLCMSTVIRGIRQKFGEENMLFIDSGDTVQGTMAGSLTGGMLPLQVLRAMGCDVWVPGNHEFDFGMERFGQLAEYMRPLLLCGNLSPVGEGVKPYAGWRMFSRDGVNIAVIGMTSSYLQNWFRVEFERNFKVEKAVDALKRIIPEVIAAKPDAIILAIHQGWTTPQQDPRGVNEVAAIAWKFPEIDLILGGHTHRPFPGNPIGNNCWYVQPLNGAIHFGHVTIYCDTEKHCVDRIESVLVESKRTNVQDETLKQMLAKPLAEMQQVADTVIVREMPVTITANGLPGKDNAMASAFCKAISTMAGTPFALHGALTKRALEAGKPVTERDLFEVVPYENNIIVGHFTQEELEEILTEQWSFRKHYSYCGFYGAPVEFDAEGKAHVSGIGEGRHAVAMNSFTAAGGGRYIRLAELLQQPETQTIDTGMTTRDAMRDYIKSLVKLED